MQIASCVPWVTGGVNAAGVLQCENFITYVETSDFATLLPNLWQGAHRTTTSVPLRSVRDGNLSPTAVWCASLCLSFARVLLSSGFQKEACYFIGVLLSSSFQKEACYFIGYVRK